MTSRPLQKRLLGALAVSMIVGAVGCGPTQSTIRINEAEVALEKARLNEAVEKAPYEFFSAKEFLHKAKEEWGFSDFEASLNYAELSRDFAEKATIKAKGGEVKIGDADGAKKTVPGAPLQKDKEADILEGLD